LFNSIRGNFIKIIKTNYIFLALVLLLFLSACSETRVNSEQVLEQENGIKSPFVEEVQELLIEEASTQEISDEEVDKVIDDNLEYLQMDKDDLNQKLEEAGLTYEQYREEVRSQLQMAKLIQENVDLDVEVSVEEVDDYVSTYEEDLKDIMDDQDLEVFKAKIRNRLTVEKQKERVMKYAESLK